MAIIIPKEFKEPRPGKFFAEGWDWFDGVDEPMYFWEEPGIACSDIRFVNIEVDEEEWAKRLSHWIGEKE